MIEHIVPQPPSHHNLGSNFDSGNLTPIDTIRIELEYNNLKTSPHLPDI